MTRVKRLGAKTLLGVAIVAVVLATAGSVVRSGLSTEPATAELDAVVATVGTRTLRSTVTLRGSVEGRPLPDLVAIGTGRVTRLYVQRGDVVDAGAAVFDLDGEPVLAVAGDVPYWRDLTVGAIGEDVAQLERMLVASGHSPGDVDERFTAATGTAIKAWQRANGMIVTGVLRPDRVLVAPWPARVRSVGVELGASVAPDDVLLEVATVERVVTLTASPAERPLIAVGQHASIALVAGGSTSNGTTVEVGDAPLVEDEVTEPRFPVIVEFDDGEAVPAGDGVGVRAEVLVAEAKEVVAVPVAAIHSDPSGRPVVTVVDGEDRRQVGVTLGLQEAGYVEVTSGLADGERVVLALE